MLRFLHKSFTAIGFIRSYSYVEYSFDVQLELFFVLETRRYANWNIHTDQWINSYSIIVPLRVPNQKNQCSEHSTLCSAMEGDNTSRV